MKYIAKYNRFVDETGRVFRKKNNGDIVECEQSISKTGYNVITCKVNGVRHTTKVHRIVFEAFNYEIPAGMVIDHINTVKTDNRLENLRCVTMEGNMNNDLTRKLLSENHKGKTAWNKNKACSIFAKKFKDYCEQNNIILNYSTEYSWYRRHNNKCRWEV